MRRLADIYRVAILAAAVTIAGCATPPAEKGATALPAGPVFFPVPPTPPRIQYLTTFTGERDFAVKGGVAGFIAGELKNPRALKQPYGVAMFEGKLYVVDSKAPGLAVFDLVQRRFSIVPGSGGGRMKRPINVTIDSDGMKYVTDTGRDQVLVFDRDDRFVQALGSPEQFRPVDTAIAGDRLFVADIKNHQVQVLDKRTGKALYSIGKPGAGQGELFQPTNLAIGPDGDLYVVETGNFRVQRFTADGKPVRTYGQSGDGPGSFARPKGIAIDKAGRLYIGDAALQVIQVFDRAGRLLLYFPEKGIGAEELSLPAGVAISDSQVELFRRYIDPDFDAEFVIFAVSQFGPNKVDVFAFGRKRGVNYPPDDAAPDKTKKP